MKVEIEPIRSEHDYQAAVADMERLWGSPAGTREGDKLDVLLDLVEAYERKHHAIPPPNPVDAIRCADASTLRVRHVCPFERDQVLRLPSPPAYP